VTKKSRHLLIAIAAVAICAPSDMSAQRRHVPDDSTGVYLGVTSRMLWRDVTLADAPALRTGVAFPIRIGPPFMIVLDGSTALRSRPRTSVGDQYEAAIHYQWIFADRPHPRSIVLGYGEIWNPNLDQLAAGLRERTPEVTASGLFDVGIESQGIRTIHFQIDAARTLAFINSTWLQGSASASMGITIPRETSDLSLAAILRAALSASDMRGTFIAAGPRPSFGFHSADIGLDLEVRNRLPFHDLGATTTLQFGGSFRAERLGPHVGWVGLRESVLFN